MQQTIALFGEARKGEIGTPLPVTSLLQLNEIFGHPPAETHGIRCAIQCLLYHYSLLYIRVKEEGFSKKCYVTGARHLLAKKPMANLTAIGLPGVGDAEIIDIAIQVCTHHHALMMIRGQDVYDYVTSTTSSH